MNDTKIEWADDTVNPWWGCQRVSPACEHCYAESLDHRFGGDHWGPAAPRKIRVEKAIGELRAIERRAAREGRPRRVFIASMSDVFEARPDLVEPRARLWEALHGLSSAVIPMLLTKRPAVMAAWAAAHGWPANVWAGTTVEDQRRADERIPHLLRVPAAVRFLSMEPLLGPVDVSPWLGYAELWDRYIGPCGCPAARDPWTRCDDCEERGWVPDPVRGIQWLITGGESGAKARPSHPDWFRSLRHQCEAAGVAFHFKQWGEFGPPGDDGFRRPVAEWKAPDGTITQTFRVGKHAAGRLLDGRTHDDFPTAGTTRHEATT